MSNGGNGGNSGQYAAEQARQYVGLGANSAPRPASQIESAFAEAQKLLSVLAQDVMTLRNRLQPVLSPAPPSTGGAIGPERSPAFSVGGAIAQVVEQTQAINRIVSQTLDELQL